MYTGHGSNSRLHSSRCFRNRLSIFKSFREEQEEKQKGRENEKLARLKFEVYFYLNLGGFKNFFHSTSKIKFIFKFFKEEKDAKAKRKENKKEATMKFISI